MDTTSGSISAIEVAEHLSLRSISGDILIIRLSGRVEASSISGSLHFLFPASLHVIGSTTSGNILYEGNLMPHGEYRLTNYSGSTDLVVASTADFELRARSVRGKVDAIVVLGSYEGNISVRRQH